MNCTLICQYIEFIADCLLVDLGCEKVNHLMLLNNLYFCYKAESCGYNDLLSLTVGK